MSPPNLAEPLTPQRLHAELLATSASGAWSYLFGAAHDATISSRHNTVRFGQADVEWLDVLRLLLKERGQKAWMYREGSTRQFWVLETSARWLANRSALFSTPEERRAYARGYFDAEGGIPRNVVARFYIQFVQKDRADIVNLRTILEEEGIVCGKLHQPSATDHPVWRFYVAAASQRDFVSRVGSWHPRKRDLLVARFGDCRQPG